MGGTKGHLHQMPPRDTTRMKWPRDAVTPTPLLTSVGHQPEGVSSGEEGTGSGAQGRCPESFTGEGPSLTLRVSREEKPL